MKYQQLTEGQRLPDSPPVPHELWRNATHEWYQPAAAQNISPSRRAGAEKTRMSPDIACFVEMAPEWLWSPEQINDAGKRIGQPVSHEWIYRHVSHDRRRDGGRYKKLRQGKRRYRRARTETRAHS